MMLTMVKSFRGLYILHEDLHGGPGSVYLVFEHCLRLNSLCVFGPICLKINFQNLLTVYGPEAIIIDRMGETLKEIIIISHMALLDSGTALYRLHRQLFQCTQYAHFNDCTNRR
jgi:hypothetical protein